jgi:hypothetical protein
MLEIVAKERGLVHIPLWIKDDLETIQEIENILRENQPSIIDGFIEVLNAHSPKATFKWNLLAEQIEIDERL